MEPAGPARRLSQLGFPSLAFPGCEREELGAGCMGMWLDLALLLCALVPWPPSLSHFHSGPHGWLMLSGMRWRGWRRGSRGKPAPSGHVCLAVPVLAALSYKQTFIYGDNCVPGHLRFSLLRARDPTGLRGQVGSSTGLSVPVIPLVLGPCVQVLSPPLAPKPCWALALLWARCPGMGSSARCLRSLSGYQQLPLVGG